jgi:hypothetical protein
VLKPGVYNFVAYGQEHEPVRLKVDLDLGQERSFTAAPRPAKLRLQAAVLSSLGITTAAVGGTFWLMGAALDDIDGDTDYKGGAAVVTLGGLALTGLGFGLRQSSPPTFEEVPNSP